MAQVIVELDGDERKALEAYSKTEAADKSLRESTAKTGKAAKDASKEFSAAWETAGKEAFTKVADAGVKSASRLENAYVDATGRVRDAYGKFISAGELATAQGTEEYAKLAAAAEQAGVKIVSNSKAQYDRILSEMRRMGPEGREQAKAVETYLQQAGVAGRRSMESIVDELKRIDPTAAAEAAKMREKMKSIGDKGKDSFTEFRISAIGDLKQIAMGYLGITSAISLVVAGTQKIIQTNKEAFDSLKQTASGDARLLQVATDDKDFQSLRGKADELSAKEGIGREEARQLVFSARSEGFEGSLSAIAKNSQFLGVEAQAKVAGQVPVLFKDEKLGSEQAIDGTLAAARASRLSFEQIASALPTAAAGLAPTGAKADETMASLSVLASKFKSQDDAATYLKSLGTALTLDKGDEKTGRESLKGMGLTAAMERLAAMTPEQRESFTGNNQELNIAVSAMLGSLAEVKKQTQVVREAMQATGTAQSLTARARVSAAEDPKLAAQKAVAVSKNELEISRETRRASNEGTRQTALNQALTSMESRGDSEESIALGELAGSAVGLVSPDMAASTTNIVSGARAEIDPARTAIRMTNPATAALSIGSLVSGARDLGRSFGQSGQETVQTPPATSSDPARLSERMVAALERQNELVLEQNALLAETADNTAPGAARPPDYNGIYNASTQEQDSR